MNIAEYSCVNSHIAAVQIACMSNNNFEINGILRMFYERLPGSNRKETECHFWNME